MSPTRNVERFCCLVIMPTARVTPRELLMTPNEIPFEILNQMRLLR